MDGSDFADRFVELQHDLIVPAAAYRLLLELESREFSITQEVTHEGTTLIVQPAVFLTPEDCAAIRRWKWHLLMLLDYCARPDNDAHLAVISEPQIRHMFAIARAAGWATPQMQAYLRQHVGIERSKDLPAAKYAEVCQMFSAPPGGGCRSTVLTEEGRSVMNQAVAPKLSLQTPTTLVCVARSVYAQYWPLPWANVMDAAERGVDGLTLQHGTPPRYMGWYQDANPAAQPDVAFLREGDGSLKGRTMLYQQNW